MCIILRITKRLSNRIEGKRKETTYQCFKEAHDGIIILSDSCRLGVLLGNLQFFGVPGERTTHRCDFLSLVFAFNYVLGAKQRFHSCNLLNADSQSNIFASHPFLPCPLIPAILHLPTGVWNNQELMRVTLPPPSALSNIFSICS